MTVFLVVFADSGHAGERSGAGAPLFITIESDSGMVSTEWVRDSLIPTINEALDDGVSLNVSTGMYAADVGDGLQLVFVTIGMKGSGELTSTAWYSVGRFICPGVQFDRLAQDAPRGHKIIWHQPAYNFAQLG